MTDTSRPHFELKQKLDPVTIAIIRSVALASERLKIRFFLAGAMARDLVLANMFERPPGRRTNDLDFAFAVENWGEYERLRNGLLGTPEFSPSATQIHRLHYRYADGLEFVVDLIPFGKLAEGNLIAWPPNQDTVMNVAGFEEALASAIPVRIDPDCTLMVASLPGLALLKLIAWRDRHTYDNRDAIDLLKILREYADAGNEDRLFDEEPQLLEQLGYHTEHAGATLLGRDAAAIASIETRKIVHDLLANEQEQEHLLRQMIQGSGLRAADFRQTCTSLLEGFRKGFESR